MKQLVELRQWIRLTEYQPRCELYREGLVTKEREYVSVGFSKDRE